MIRGVTFTYQTVAAVDHGTLFKNIFDADGILKGCEISFSGSGITLGAGYLMVAGRLIQNTAAVTLTADASGAYSRLLVTIDTTLPASTDDFQQVSFTLDYAATPTGFAALTQDDINAGTGNVYQAALCVFAMTGATVSSIYSGPNYTGVSAATAATAEQADSATLAASATQLATSRNFSVQDNDGTNTGPTSGFRGLANVVLKLPATIKAAIVGNVTGNVTGNASTATRLATSRTIRTNLASTSAASFDGSGNVTPGVTGTLPAANGGTGNTSLKDAGNAMLKAFGPGYVAAVPLDSMEFICTDDVGNFVRRKMDRIAAYIFSKLTAANIPDLPASKITSGEFGSARLASGAVTSAKIADGAVTNGKIASGVAASKVTGEAGTLGAFSARRIYIGTSAPGSSVGAQGDLYIVY